MSRHYQRLESLFDIATELPNVYRARVVAAVYWRNRQISVASNSIRSDPFHKRYSQEDYKIYLHAETGAIKSALRLLDTGQLEQCIMYVARARKNNNGDFEFGLAKPCQGCMRALVEFRFKSCWYTTGNQQVKRL